MRALAVVGWKEYQHYKKRDPIWIKLYQKTLTTEVWVLGNDVSRLVQLASTLLAARYDNQIPMKWELISRVAHFGFTETEFEAAVAHLIAFNFLEIIEVDEPIKANASNPLATCITPSPTMLAQSRGRVETETEKEAHTDDASAVLAECQHPASEHGGNGAESEPTGTNPPHARPRLVDDPNDHAQWQSVVAVYPAGSYGAEQMLIGEKRARQRVAEGFTWNALRAATEAMAAQKRAQGKIGTEFVWSPANFFGPDVELPGRFIFQREFKLPVAVDKHALERQQREAREAAEMQVLVDGRAARGLLDFREPYGFETPGAYATSLRLEEQARRGKPSGDIAGVVAGLSATMKAVQ